MACKIRGELTTDTPVICRCTAGGEGTWSSLKEKGEAVTKPELDFFVMLCIHGYKDLEITAG